MSTDHTDHNVIDSIDHQCLVCGATKLRISERGFSPDGQRVVFKCSDCMSTGTLTNIEPYRGRELSLDVLKGMFAIARIPIIGKPKALSNQYWGNILPNVYPWWFVKTPFGWIELGWRKRVLEIDWSDTPVRTLVTTDDVTKSDTMVHAYSNEAAVKYLCRLSDKLAHENTPGKGDT